jgi:parallel beta-helix repeat protein
MNGGVKIKKPIALLLAFFILISVSGIGMAGNTTTIKPGISVIQAAVNNAGSGDVIILEPGTYYDNVKITKENLTIKSSSGNPDDTWVRASKSTADVFLVQANSTKIYGLKISGATASRCSAINLSSSRYCAIENNKLMNNLRGINLLYAHWNVISKNTATSNNEYGIVLGNATANTISGNTVYSNYIGIHCGNSDSNTFKDNNVRGSSYYGFYVCPRSDMNTIYNNYFNETNITIKNGIGNHYNIAKTAGTNIVGGPYIGGNYWAKPDGTGFSQKAVDSDGDGISDSAYANISGSIYSDSLPLVTPGPAPILPVADFISNVTSGSTPLTVLFTSKSTNAASVSWNFGDGTAAVTGTPVSHKFINTGTSAQTFTVTLTATNSNGTSTKTGTIKVNPVSVVKPVASFTVSPTSGGTTATTYTFTDNSTNAPANWTWNFGDGQNAAGKSVTHKFASAKTYTVTLTAGNTAGSSTATKSVVVGTAAAKPVALFTISPTSGISTSTTCTFTSTSTNSPSTLTWKFGDGGTASGSKVTHKFTKAGTITATLTVSNSAGSSTASKTVSVAAVKPAASFTYSPTTVKKGATITFTSSSTNYPTALKWTFADNGATSTASKPTHVFSKTGSFRATLVASNSAGTSTVYKTITVT